MVKSGSLKPDYDTKFLPAEHDAWLEHFCDIMNMKEIKEACAKHGIKTEGISSKPRLIEHMFQTL